MQPSLALAAAWILHRWPTSPGAVRLRAVEALHAVHEEARGKSQLRVQPCARGSRTALGLAQEPEEEPRQEEVAQ